MYYLNLKISALLGLSVFLLITQSVSASELLMIARSEEKAYCPAYYDSQFCSADRISDVCTKGVEVVVETATDLSEALVQSEKLPSLDADRIFTMINNYRADLGLSPYVKEEKLCSLARERGPELYDEIFVNGNIHGGLYDRDLPWWITENMKYGGSEESVFHWWLSSPIHRKAIEGDFTLSCGECFGNSCVQLFTSYTPK